MWLLSLLVGPLFPGWTAVAAGYSGPTGRGRSIGAVHFHRWVPAAVRPGFFIGVWQIGQSLARGDRVLTARASTRACQGFCVSGLLLQVGADSFGVGGGELGEGLFPVGGDLSFDHAGLGLAFAGG